MRHEWSQSPGWKGPDRGYGPCAGCQGHSGKIRFREASGDQLQLEDIEPVGGYALGLNWFDGHASGIYSFKFLRALCQCSECRAGEGPLPATPR